MPAVLRGVNIGGWLVLEKWMNGDMFTGAHKSAVDQYTYDSVAGNSASLLETHWTKYFTEDDVAQMASWGINA